MNAAVITTQLATVRATTSVTQELWSIGGVTALGSFASLWYQ